MLFKGLVATTFFLQGSLAAPAPVGNQRRQLGEGLGSGSDSGLGSLPFSIPSESGLPFSIPSESGLPFSIPTGAGSALPTLDARSGRHKRQLDGLTLPTGGLPFSIPSESGLPFPIPTDIPSFDGRSERQKRQLDGLTLPTDLPFSIPSESGLPFSIPSESGLPFSIPTGAGSALPTLDARSGRHRRQLDGFALPTGGLPSFSMPSAAIPTSLSGLSGLGSSGTGDSSALSGLGSSGSSGSSALSGLSGLGSSGSSGSSALSGLSGLGSSGSSGSSGLSSLAARSGDTENDVTSNTGCKAVTVIFARGTTETGNVGTVAGPPMFTALKKTLGDSQVAVQGVDYDASIQGNFEMGADGGPTMVTLVNQALSQCPNTKIVLSGYSQGGFIVHYAAAKLTAAQIAGAVIFGDPENGSAVTNVPSSNLLEICATGDEVCQDPKTYTITAAHLTYGNNAQQAADFIVKVTGVAAATS